MPLKTIQPSWDGVRALKPIIHLIEVAPRPGATGDIIYLLVERSESIEYVENSKEIHSASVQFSYQQVLPNFSFKSSGNAPFTASYSKTRNRVSLTSSIVASGAVFLDPEGLRGRGIGTYLMNEIIGWVKSWPDAHVNEIELLDETDEDNRLRRNKFYQQFGIQFEWEDLTKQGAANALPMLVNQLQQVDTFNSFIKQHNIDDFLGNLTDENYQLKLTNKHLQKEMKELYSSLFSSPFLTMCTWVWAKL